MKNRIIALIIVAIAAGSLFGIALTHKNASPAPTPTPTATVSASPTPITYVTYNGEDGVNALDLLKKGHTVDTKTESFGTFVNGIDGHAGDDKHFWSFYVNGTAASVGADSYVTKSGDKIEWKYEEIK